MPNQSKTYRNSQSCTFSLFKLCMSIDTRPQTICADTSYLPCWRALLLPVSINRSEATTQAPASTDVICAGGPRKCPQAQIAFICAGGPCKHLPVSQKFRGECAQCPKNFITRHQLPLPFYYLSCPLISPSPLSLPYLFLSTQSPSLFSLVAGGARPCVAARSGAAGRRGQGPGGMRPPAATPSPTAGGTGSRAPPRREAPGGRAPPRRREDP